MFEDTGSLLIAAQCDILKKFDCSGGVFSPRRKLTRRTDVRLLKLFDLAGASGLRRTSLAIADQERSLSECSGTSCDCSKVTGTVENLKCRAKNVEGLSFPFMSDLSSLVDLLSGGDIVR